MALSQVGLERLNTATTKKIGTSKNLIINGSHIIAQRGSSGTVGVFVIDRFPLFGTGHDEAPTQVQGSISSSDTGPYEAGFTKTLKITNGNQTSGAGASDRLFTQTKLEARDIANSGWNYKSSSSFITLSFWVKSSVAQNFFGDIRTFDGTAQGYAFETGSLTADTWTKITKTIPGNSNLQFDNDVDSGLTIVFGVYHGTDFTDAGVTLNQWGTYNGSQRQPTNTTTWYTTDNATWEYTGVQLEVGSVATDFEFRSPAQELLLCQRYFQAFESAGDSHMLGAAGDGTTTCKVGVPLSVPLRASPTVACGSHRWYRSSSVALTTSTTAPAIINFSTAVDSPVIAIQAGGHTVSNNEAGVWSPHNGNDLTLDCEL